MQLTIDKSALVKLLARAAAVVDRRVTIPVLANVRLHARAGRVEATATDMDMEAAVTVAAEVRTAGTCTAPAHALHDIARRLPDGAQVALAHDAAAGRLTVTAGRARFTLATLPVEDFPVFGLDDAATCFAMPAAALAGLLDRTRFAVSTEETRYYLNGVYLHVDENDRLVAAATDGHRLAVATTPLAEGAPGLPAVIVPRKAVAEIRKMLDGVAEVTLAVSETRLRLEAGDAVLATKLMDGTFPDYARVIPAAGDAILEADAAELAAALDRVAAVSADKSRGVKLSLAPGSVTLAASGDDGNAATDELDPERCRWTGPDREIGFNGRYLADILAAADADRVALDIGTVDGPARLTAPADDSALWVLMPMRI